MKPDADLIPGIPNAELVEAVHADWRRMVPPRQDTCLNVFRRLVLYPDCSLRRPTKAVTEFDDELRGQVEDMRELLRKGHVDKEYAHFRGYALAAPQVGYGNRVFVVAPTYSLQWPAAVVNPEIISPEGSTLFRESCLSLPGLFASNRRYTNFILKYQDEFGVGYQVTADGLFAIVAQHEIDHLDGKLFIDRLDSVQRAKADKYINKHIRHRK